MVDDVRATGRHVPAVGRGTQPAGPLARARPVPGLGVQGIAAALRHAAREAVRRAAAPYAADVDAAIAAHRPDVVLCAQFAFGAMVAAEAAAIPFDVLMPNVYLLPGEGVTPFGLGLRPAKGAPGRARDGVVQVDDPPHVGQGPDEAQHAPRASVGSSPLAHFMDQPTRARRCGCSPRPSSTSSDGSPANVRYVGPVLDDPNWATDDWTPPPGDDPLVLVGLSSTFQDHAATLQRIVDALSTLPVRAIVTTGPALDAGSVTGHRQRRGRVERTAQRGARARRRGRHPRRPRHGDQGARRRRPDGRAPPRARPAGQRRARRRHEVQV